MDERLIHKCSMMEKAVEDDLIHIEHEDIDEKGIVPIVQIKSVEAHHKMTLIYFCPWCGAKLGNWLTDGTTCVVEKIEPMFDEPDYDLEGEGPDAS